MSLPLWTHVAVFATLLVLLIPGMEVDRAGWIDDEGLYGLQVEALEEGAWAYEYDGASFGHEDDSFPLLRAERGADGAVYPYVRHPAYPLALKLTADVFGSGAGVYVLPLLGLVLAAVSGWFLAAGADRRSAVVAFWLVAVSPLLVNGYVIWAHTLSAATAGLALVAAVRIVRRGLSIRDAGTLAACAAVGVLLRSEMVLFAVALALGLGFVLVRSGRVREAAITLPLILLPMGLTVLGEMRWIHAIVGVPQGLPESRFHPGGRSFGSLAADRARATWRVLFDSGDVASRLELFVMIALAALVIGGLTLRVRDPSHAPVVLVALGGTALVALLLYRARFADAPLDAASGLFAAWPIVLLGLVAMPWKQTTDTERLVVAVVLLFAGAVFATQYEVGGGSEWGGRFLSPVVAPMATLVAIGLCRRLVDHRWRGRWAAVAMLAAVAVYPATRGLEAIATGRRFVSVLAGEAVSVSSPVLVVGHPDLNSLPLWAWRTHDEVAWLVPKAGSLGPLLATLGRSGIPRVTVIVRADQPLPPSPYRLVANMTGPWTQEHSLWRVLELHRP